MSLEFTDEASLALIDEASEEHFLNCFAQRVSRKKFNENGSNQCQI